MSAVFPIRTLFGVALLDIRTPDTLGSLGEIFLILGGRAGSDGKRERAGASAK